MDGKGGKGELEREFFDGLAKKIETVEPSRVLDIYTRCAFGVLKNLQGKRVLDLGCGDGKSTHPLAEKAESVIGIDISLLMLKQASKRGKRSNLLLARMVCEDMGFKDECFDIVFGGYILHHLDFSLATKEIYRVLKKGGTGVFVENFAFNPILRFFRKNFTGRFGIPRYGTKDEHPLTYRDVRLAKSLFKRVEIVNPDLNFIKLFDRQIFRYQCPFISRFCELFDKWLWHSFKGLRRFSYTQVMIVRKK